MNKKLIFLIVVALLVNATSAQVTKVGNDTLLDVAGWNVEWFGDASNGPSDEALQYANVKAVLKNTDLDVWGLAEVSNPATFTTLMSELTDYAGVSSSFSQTQKTAMIWKKSKFELLSSGNVLTESTYSYDFASRPPLEVVLKSKDNNITDTFYFYVLHLKANTGTQVEKVTSYNRRKNAAGYLKTFLDTNRRGKKVIVLGDWNDDLDESIVYDNGVYLTTPFSNFLNDSQNYFYTSYRLTMGGKQSTASYPNMIDHQLISDYMRDSFYVAASSEVMTATAAQVTNYKNNTSDHYPVLSRYNMKRYFKEVPPPTGTEEIQDIADFIVYPNPAGNVVHIDNVPGLITLQLLTTDGRLLAETHNKELHTHTIEDGLYLLMIHTENGTAIHKVQIQHASAH